MCVTNPCLFPDGSASGEGEGSGDERASPAAMALSMPRAPHAVSAASAATAAVLVSPLRLFCLSSYCPNFYYVQGSGSIINSVAIKHIFLTYTCMHA